MVGVVGAIALLLFASNKVLAERLPSLLVTSGLTGGEWVPVDFSGIQTNKDNLRVVVVEGELEGIQIQCKAKYPIELKFSNDRWKYENKHIPRGIQHVNYRRITGNFYNSSTYIYIGELIIQSNDNKMTGMYSCNKVGDTSTFSSFYVFWEGASPPYFLDYGEKQTLYYDKTPFVIPCRVSVPSVVPTLFRVYEVTDGNGTVIITERLSTKDPIDSSDIPFALAFQNGSDPVQMKSTGTKWLYYDHTVGFVFNLTDKVDDYIKGNYRCRVEGDTDEEDVVDYQVIVGSPKQDSPDDEINSDNLASFGYDPELGKFVCCSSNKTKAPSMAMMYCDHPTICALKKPVLDEMVNSGKRHGPRGSGCTSMQVTYQMSGIVKCSGPGIRVFREFLFPDFYKFRQSFKENRMPGRPFYSWSNANFQDLLEVKKNTNESYVGQTVSVYCYGVPFYFAEGIIWMLRYANNTSTIIKVVGTDKQKKSRSVPKSRFYFRQLFSVAQVTIDRDLISVSCFVPVWNSSEWIEKPFTITPKEPTLPKLIGATHGDVEDVTWTLYDRNKTLHCNFTGDPKPQVLWRFNHALDTFQPFFSPWTSNRTGLYVDVVTEDLEGEFTCIGRSFAGNVTKTFRVRVVDPPQASQPTHTGLIVGTVLGIGLVLAINATLYVLHSKGKLRQLCPSLSLPTSSTPENTETIATDTNGTSRFPSFRNLLGRANANVIQEFNNPLSVSTIPSGYNRF